MQVSVIGLGKLGAPLMATLGAAGMNVVGCDLLQSNRDLIRAGVSPFSETDLQKVLSSASAFVSVADTIHEAVLSSDVTLIVVPTPSLPDGSFDASYVVQAVSSVGHAISKKDGKHAVCVCSTVSPGTMRGVVEPALEAAAGQSLSADLHLFYHPFFVALGSVIHNLRHPDLILIGANEEHQGAGELIDVISRIWQTEPDVRVMNYTEAEIAKISVNCFVTMKISFANTLGEMCENLPDTDAHVITEAIGCDRRIGKAYLKPGLGFGGPCFPRDNIAFAAAAASQNCSADLALATDRINNRQVDRAVHKVKAAIAPGGCVTVLGLSYKPDTGVTDESQGVMIANRLADVGYRVIVWDAMAKPNGDILNATIRQIEDVSVAMATAEVVLIATPWNEIVGTLASYNGSAVIIDCWQ